MEGFESDNPEDPLSVWKVYNSLAITLFNDLDQAAGGLESMLRSIINLNTNIQVILVVKPNASECLRKQCCEFNKWLLCRIFFILTDDRFEKIHCLSQETQSLILTVLHSAGAGFFSELFLGYSRALSTLVNHYTNNLEQDNEILLQLFALEEVETVLDLTPFPIRIRDRSSLRNVIIYLMEILCRMTHKTKVFVAYSKVNRTIVETILDVYERSDFKLKSKAMKFFIGRVSSDGISHYDKNMVRFFDLTDEFINMLPVVFEDNIKGFESDFKEVNAQMKLLLDFCLKEELHSEYLAAVWNVAEFVLDCNAESRCSPQRKWEFESEVSKISKLVVDKLILTRQQMGEGVHNFDSLVKSAPSLYLTKLQRDVSRSRHGEAVALSESSPCFRDVLYPKLLHSVERIRAENCTPLVLGAHLGHIIDLLDVLCQFKIMFLSKADHRNVVALEIFSADMCHSFLESIIAALKSSLHKSSQPLKECSAAVNIFTKVLFLTHNVCMSDVLTVLEVESFSCSSNWMSNYLHNSGTPFHEDEQRCVLLKVLLTQVLVLPNNPYVTKMRELCSHLLTSSLDLDNKEVRLEVMKNSPLMLLSGVSTVQEVLTTHLYPCLVSHETDSLHQLVQVLPTLVCVVWNSFDLALTATDSRKQSHSHHMSLAFGYQLNLSCVHCHKSRQDLGKHPSMVIRPSDSLEYWEANKKMLNEFLKEFLHQERYLNIQHSDLVKLFTNASNHSMVGPSSLDSVLRPSFMQYLSATLESLVSNTLSDMTKTEEYKSEIINSILIHLLQMSKSSLEGSEGRAQDVCLECVRQFGKVQRSVVVLASVKMCVMFVMHHNSLYGAKAVLHIREICEAHHTTPVEVYHRYKMDLCRVVMELAAFNCLLDQDCTWCIAKVVRVFGFVTYRDFVTKDIEHALPYLIPLVVKNTKLRAMVTQMASVINCTPSEFISERFPQMYAHIYITESEAGSESCFRYIEEVSGNKIVFLIKKHFRVILTEFLMQYCSGPEKVLEACRWLARNDPEYTPKLSNSPLNLTQVADFIQPRFLGVLAHIDSKLVNTKVAVSIKRKALQSFPHILSLMGSRHITPLRFKILATLRTALMSEYPALSAAAWSAFIHNVDTAVLGPMLATIFVSLLPLRERAKAEIDDIFEYLVVKNETLLSTHIPDLFFIRDSSVSPDVKQIISRHVQRTRPQPFIDKIKWLLRYLSCDSSGIKAHTLQYLLDLMRESQGGVSEAVFGNKGVHPTVTELVDTLLAGCRDKDPNISKYSGMCLGALGAVEPSLLPRQLTPQPNGEHSPPFAFSISDQNFIKQALTELTRAFHAEKHTKNMDCYALAIQEILKTFSIAPDGPYKHLWDSFPENVHQIMLPLLSTRYILAIPTNPKQVHPVYGSSQAATFNEWAFNWTSQLISHIGSGSTQEVLKSVHPSLKRDLSTLVLFLPYVVLQAILSDSSVKAISEEVLAVIGADSFNHDSEGFTSVSKYKTFVTLNFSPRITPLVHEEGTQLKCRKMVYVLLDFLNRWLLEWTHNKKDAYKDDNYVKIKTFLDGFCKLTISRGNFLCGELERSLQYLEMYVEGSQCRLHEQLAYLAEIYVVLNEPDCVAGILRMKQSEPSLRELVLAHKVTGQLQDAATCYEKAAQQGDLDEETLQGMVEAYLGLDQPYTALSLLQGADIKADGGLAAEPMWRLGRFEDLDKLLQEPDVCEDRQWGVRVGHCLLALRKGERPVLAEHLCSAREALLRRLGECSSSSAEVRRGYTHSYHNALGLHMLEEIHHLEDLVYQIKGLSDHSAECGTIIDKLIEEWDLRLRLLQASSRTVEPVLRLRRILLEQSKELLQSTHPQTTAMLNSHIGKIWLQSSKFARKASIYQQAYIYILNAEKYTPKELFIEKAKLYWERGQQEPAFYTLKRGLEEHFPALSQLSAADRKICAQAKLLTAIYNEQTTNVDMDVNIVHYKEAVEVYRQWEKSLVYLAEYYEKVYSALSAEEKTQNVGGSARAQALNCYGKALQYGHNRLYQSMPRMLSIWLDFEVVSTDPKSQSMMTLKQICSIIDTFSKRLPLYLFLTAFSQIISRICHPIKEVYDQLKAVIIELVVAYPQHSLWMMMCVIKSSYPQRIKRCQEILGDARLRQQPIAKMIYDFNQLAEKLIELCNKPIAAKIQTTQVSTLVRSLPKLLASDGFTPIMMPHEQFVKVVLPYRSVNKEPDTNFNPFSSLVYITGIEETVTVFPSLQRPRRITFKGSDGRKYNVMLKPKDDLRKDFRLQEFNSVVNRYLQESAEARERRLYIRTYSVLPLNEECGIIEWVDNLTGLRPILFQLYKEAGMFTTMRELKEMMCDKSDPLSKKRNVFEKQLLPRHPPIFDVWFRYTFPDPHTWYQARSAYIRTTAVMSMVGYILGLGDRHGENILFDSTSGDTVHVDFNCLFNKGESFELPERVPFRLTHNMTHAMGPLGLEGMYRKCCEVTLRVLKSQTSTLMSVIRPFVYDPLVAWQKSSAREGSGGERTNQLAKEHLMHIKQRLEGMVMTKDKQFSLSLSPQGQANHLILEATSVVNLCQMYIGWGPYL